MTYADPYGDWFDTMLEDELHLYGEYRKEDVKGVQLYTDAGWGYSLHSSYDTIEDAYKFLKEQGVY
jgi:hypothetical protein